MIQVTSSAKKLKTSLWASLKGIDAEICAATSHCKIHQCCLPYSTRAGLLLVSHQYNSHLALFSVLKTSTRFLTLVSLTTVDISVIIAILEMSELNVPALKPFLLPAVLLPLYFTWSTLRGSLGHQVSSNIVFTDVSRTPPSMATYCPSPCRLEAALLSTFTSHLE